MLMDISPEIDDDWVNPTWEQIEEDGEKTDNRDYASDKIQTIMDSGDDGIEFDGKSL